MTAQPDVETGGHSPPPLLGSEDSDEETSQEEQPITNWSELSIIERVGLNSVDISEKDLERAFSQIALAFSSDQYTLKQRLQAEEHARNLAEENVQLELTRGRETLELLKGLCLDTKRSKILQKLELCLDILGGTVERISNTAEVLGAVHQEARVSHAVELMVAHVENLRRRHDRNTTELEEAKKAIQQQNSDSRASPDPDESDGRKRSSYQSSGRRRVSVTLIPSQIQDKIKQDFKKCATPGRSLSKESFLSHSSPAQSSQSSCSAPVREDCNSADGRPMDPDESQSEAPAADLPPPLVPNAECLPPKQHAGRTLRTKNSPLDTLRQRHKGKAVSSKKKADKEKRSNHRHQQLSTSTCGSSWRHRPMAHWLHRCPWTLLCTYLLVLLCVITLIYFLLKLHSEASEL